MSFKTSLIIYALYSAPTIIHHNMWNKLQLGFAVLLFFIFIFFFKLPAVWQEQNNFQ